MNTKVRCSPSSPPPPHPGLTMVNTHIASVGNQMTQHNRALGHGYRPLGHAHPLPTPRLVETQAQRARHVLHPPVPPLPSALAQRPLCTGMGRKRKRHSRDSVVVKVMLPDPAALQSPVSKRGLQRSGPGQRAQQRSRTALEGWHTGQQEQNSPWF